MLLEKRPTDAVVDVGGLGYALSIPASSFDKLPAVGQPVKLLARQVIREDAHLLFGFASEAERALFDAMISVQGVGPKLAERIVRELKDRAGGVALGLAAAAQAVPTGAGADAVSALLNLGFRPAEAAGAAQLLG